MFKRGRFEIVETFTVVDLVSQPSIPLNPIPNPVPNSNSISIPVVRKGRFEICTEEFNEDINETKSSPIQLKYFQRGRFEIYTDITPSPPKPVQPLNYVRYGRFEITNYDF